jgi:four helix bundle protein
MSETARQRDSETGIASAPSNSLVRTFRDLVAWQRGMELSEAVYTATARMPDAERFGLTAQIRRAAVSVPSNIAEGHGRQSRSDYLRYLHISRGSLADLSTQLELAVRLRFLPPDQQLTDLINEEARILQALIKSLQRLDRTTGDTANG